MIVEVGLKEGPAGSTVGLGHNPYFSRDSSVQMS